MGYDGQLGVVKDAVMKLLQLGLLISCWLGIVGRTHAESGALEAIEHPTVVREALRTNTASAIRGYCQQIRIGRVLAESSIQKMSGGFEKESAQRELQKAKELLTVIRSIHQSLQLTNMDCAQKADCLISLCELNGKIMHEGEIGVGNIELSSALVFVVVGNFFACASDLNETNRNRVISFVRNCFSEPQAKDLRNALQPEMLGSFGFPVTSSVDDILRNLAEGIGTNRVNEAASAQAPVEILAQRLARKTKNSVHEQLQECDPDWLVWDVICANRFRAYCRLIPYVSGKPQSEEEVLSLSRQFREEGIGKLGIAEKSVLRLGLRKNSREDELEGNLLIETRQLLRTRGRSIIEMTSSRL